MKATRDYPEMVSSFFKKHLAGTRNASVNTIRSYRDAFVVFNDYLVKQKKLVLERMSVGDLSRDLVLNFLCYLESERGCGASSRNHRLAALSRRSKIS